MAIWLDNPKRRRTRRRSNAKGSKRRRRRNSFAANRRRTKGTYRRRRNTYTANTRRRRRYRRNPIDANLKSVLVSGAEILGGMIGTRWASGVAKSMLALPESVATNAAIKAGVAYFGAMVLKDLVGRDTAFSFAVGGIVEAGLYFLTQSNLANLAQIGEYGMSYPEEIGEYAQWGYPAIGEWDDDEDYDLGYGGYGEDEDEAEPLRLQSVR